MAQRPAPPTAAGGRLFPWRLPVAFLLGIGAIVLNRFYQPALLTAETPPFLFGGALVFLAFLLTGQLGGLIAATLQAGAIAWANIQISGDPILGLLGLLYLLEAWVSWRLVPLTGNLVLAVMAFWYGGGWLLDVGFFLATGRLSGPYVTLLFVKQVFNGIANVLLAQAIAAVLPKAWRPPAAETPQPLRRFTLDRLLLLVLPPAALLGLLYTRATLQDSLSRAKLRQQAMVSDIALEVRQFLTSHEGELSVLTDRVQAIVLAGRTNGAEALLREFEAHRPEIVLAAIADAGGRVTTMAPDTSAGGTPLARPALSSRQYFQELRRERLPVVAPLAPGDFLVSLGDSTGPVIVLGHPMVDSAGAFRGAVLSALDVAALRPLVSGSGVGDGATVTLLDRARRVIISSDPRLPAGLEFGQLMASSLSVGASGEEFAFNAPTGAASAAWTVELRYGIYRPIESASWGVVVDFGAARLHREMLPALQKVIAVFAIVPLLLLGLVRVVSRQISSPLHLVGRAAESIARGRMAAGEALAPLAASPVGEIRDLAGEFVAMGEALAGQAAESRRREAESEERFRRTFENPVVGILHLSPDGQPLRVNDRLLELLAYDREEMLVVPLTRLVPTRSIADVQQAWRNVVTGARPGSTLTTPAVRKDGRTLELQLNFTPVRDEDGRLKYVIVAVEDLTERRALEHQLLQAQKMEAIGLLAGGVAHDFNNLLTPIMGYTDMALEQTGHDPSLASDLQQIRAAAERARDLTQQLLAFGRKQVLEMRPVHLGEVLEQFRRLLRPLVRENIVLTTSTDADLGMVRADVTQVQQVIMNLCVNAVDAMPDGGHLTLEARNLAITDPDTARSLEIEPGLYVALVVRDTGHGMTPEVRGHLFEPFFTTKERGKGTGLGLATVYGIVRQHDGAIQVTSAPGRGTTFTVFFPRVEARQTPRPAPDGATDRRSRTRDEWILVVEDEPAVRQLLRTILQRRGYRVMEATSGEEALTRLEGIDGQLPLLCTDVIMPGMSGRELFDRLRTRYPRLRALFVSGYTGEALGAARRGLEPGTAFLQKPFAPEDLIRRLDQLLDESR
ncbi:MAG: ATP-binding protein [Gemmatimonadales bacterium]